MRVIGAADIEAAGRVLQVARGDVVTPLALERARELGVVLQGVGAAEHAASSAVTTRVDGPAVARTGTSRRPAAPASSAPPSGALYRRGAPVILGRQRPSAGNGAAPTARVTVTGAGHVGSVTAMLLAGTDAFAEVLLTDVVPGLAEGLALDLQHSSGVGGFKTRIVGASDLEAIAESDFVVITAGRPRQPGMSRTDLAEANALIVREVAAEVRNRCPNAVVLVVTNPLDEMTDLVWRETGFPSQRVLGMAGVLDAARFVALASLAGAGPPATIQAVALGSHGDEMVIPLSQATAGGRPITEVLDSDTLAQLVARTRDSGAEVVRLLQRGSAYFAPSAAIAQMVLAMTNDSGELLPSCVRADGAFGLSDVYVGLPARLGRGGVREIVELPLTGPELESLRDAAGRIAKRVAALA